MADMQNDYFNYKHDQINEPEPITFPEPELPPPVPPKSPSMVSSKKSSSHAFDAKFKAERDAYYSNDKTESPRISDERDRQDLLGVLKDHIAWQRQADFRQKSRQEHLIAKLVDDTHRIEQLLEAQRKTAAAQTNVRTMELELTYARDEIERTKARLAAAEDDKMAAEDRVEHVTDKYRRLALTFVRHQSTEVGRRRGLQDGYNLFLKQGMKGIDGEFPDSMPTGAYIEEVYDDDDDAASRLTTGTEIVRDTRPRYFASDYGGSRRRRDESRSKHRSSDHHRSHSYTTQSRPSRTSQSQPMSRAPSQPPSHAPSQIPSQPPSQPPSRPPSRHSRPASRAPSQATSRASSVDRSMPHHRMTPFRKLSDIPEASNSADTPRSQNFPPVQSPGMQQHVTSPLRNDFGTPAAGPSRQTQDNYNNFPTPQSRSRTMPPAHEASPQIRVKPPSPEPRMIPPPPTHTPRSNGTQALPRSTSASQSAVPYSSASGPRTSQPAVTYSFPVPPIPIPDFRAPGVPYTVYRPPTLDNDFFKIPDSEPDTGTMTPLSESVNLSSFPRMERDMSSRLSAIHEGGSTVSGSVAPSPLPEIREPNTTVEEWRRSTSTDATPQFNPNMLQPPMPNSAHSSQNSLSPTQPMQRRGSSGSRSTHSIEFNIEPPSRPPSLVTDTSNAQATGFLSPNHAPQALPLERPDQGPVIPDSEDYGDDASADASDDYTPPASTNGIPYTFVAQPPANDLGNQTPKMVPSNSWGQHAAWGTAGSGSGGAWPANGTSHGGLGKSGPYAPPSSSGGSRTPRVAYAAQTTPPGYSYPLPPGRAASDSKKKVRTRPSSRSSTSSDSASTSSSASQNPPDSRRTPLYSPAVRSSLQGGILKAGTKEGESPPDPTTYMNTLANSATGTPRFGKGSPYLANGTGTPRLPGQSPYAGPKSLYG